MLTLPYYVLRCSCLQTWESLGLGEGWSDAFAECVDVACHWNILGLTSYRYLRWTYWTNSTVTDFVLAAYIFNNPAGIRRYPYSTNP